MEKSLKELLKDPDSIGISEIAEFACHGYDKSLSDMVRLLDAYAESIGRQHKKELALKDKQIALKDKQIEAAKKESNMYQKKYFDIKNSFGNA